MTVKAEFKEFIRKLIALDMNVIVTAREKTKYKEGSFMVAMGETFDGEKSLPYMFDTIVRMYVDDKGRHMGTCLKDRSNKLPKEEFECSYENFEQFFGKQSSSAETRRQGRYRLPFRYRAHLFRKLLKNGAFRAKQVGALLRNDRSRWPRNPHPWTSSRMESISRVIMGIFSLFR